MPNHCDNDLFVSCKRGDVQLLTNFIKRAEGKTDNDDGEIQPLDYNSFVPYPQTYEDYEKTSTEFWNEVERVLVEKAIESKCSEEEIEIIRDEIRNKPKDGYNNGGYEWCIDNWGTKWNAYHVTLKTINSQRVKYNFNSAWSPPTPVVNRMSQMFPRLKFELKFYERGAEFCGRRVWENGRLIVNELNKEYHGYRGG